MAKNYVKNGVLTNVVSSVAPARLSLAGNPGDLKDQVPGMHGGFVLSVPMWSRIASAALMPSISSKSITPPRDTFPTHAAQIRALKERGIGEWEHLVDNAMLIFDEMLQSIGQKPFEVSFSSHIDTNIPRQRGMSGSSGVIIALFNALITVYEISEYFPPEVLAPWALKVEKTLGVNAGLQDRVLQSYCSQDRSISAVAMDFSTAAYKKNGGKNGEFSPLKLGSKKLFRSALILSQNPSHSGAAHAGVKKRLAAKEKSLHRQFDRLTEIGVSARDAFAAGDWSTLGDLMTKNANMRVEIYGARKLGKDNMALLDVCRRAGCPCNFTGSGGAVVVMLPEDIDSYHRLEKEIEKYSERHFEIYLIN